MMKKNFLLAGSFIFVVIAAIGSYHTYTSNSAVEDGELLMANVEALSTGSDVSHEEVKCYCKQKWFSPNICSINVSGGYCGGNPCSNHDGNCR